MYLWFSNMFGVDLDSYFAGLDCEGNFVGPDCYIKFGFIALGISLFMVVLYYYIINSTKFNKWWSWLIVLLISGFTNFFIGARIALRDYYTIIPECWINGEMGGITEVNCWMFGLANLFISTMFFVVLSFILKWWSINCKRSPF